MPGPGLPRGIQLVEGPVVAKEGRCSVDVIVDETQRVPANLPIAAMRPMTQRDGEILAALGKEERRRAEVLGEIMLAGFLAGSRCRMLKPLEGDVARVEYRKVENGAELTAIARNLKPGTISQLIFAGHGSRQALALGRDLVFHGGDDKRNPGDELVGAGKPLERALSECALRPEIV